MRRLTRFLWLSLLSVLTVGCAGLSRTPTTLDCRELGLTPVIDAGQRLEFSSPGFSVLPPQGGYWCIQQSDPGGVVFVKSPLLGQRLNRRPNLRETTHTFAATAREVIVEEAELDNPEELQAFVKRWLLGGARVRVADSTVVLDTAPLRRFKLIDSKVDLENPFGAKCVRFDAVIEERDNPLAPGAVLIQINPSQFLCRHPHSRERIFLLIGYSERYLQEEQPRPLLVETWKQEVEPFVRSLRFSPPR